MQIIFNDNKINKEKKITNLFKVFPSLFLALEDCDIVFRNKKRDQKISGHQKNIDN